MAQKWVFAKESNLVRKFGRTCWVGFDPRTQGTLTQTFKKKKPDRTVSKRERELRKRVGDARVHTRRDNLAMKKAKMRQTDIRSFDKRTPREVLFGPWDAWKTKTSNVQFKKVGRKVKHGNLNKFFLDAKRKKPKRSKK